MNGCTSLCRHDASPVLWVLDAKQPREDMFLLGDSFMRTYYTHFDRAKKQIGFARANPNPTVN
eukprot:EC716602.1.p4 GENE.EC716602.1~~EC716602.1.p4  ORF type:complete len:63 (+),score=8.15 EC716602.1:103-291(+)